MDAEELSARLVNRLSKKHLTELMMRLLEFYLDEQIDKAEEKTRVYIS